MRLLVTGGCGFIGSNFIRYVLEHYQPEMITNVDALTYAGSLASTADFAHEFGDRYEFLRADIANWEAIDEVLGNHSYFAIVNFAAESHVDRSIASPGISFKPMSSEQIACWKPPGAMGSRGLSRFQPMKSMVLSTRRIDLLNKVASTRVRPIQPAKQRPISWSWPLTKPLLRMSF